MRIVAASSASGRVIVRRGNRAEVVVAAIPDKARPSRRSRRSVKVRIACSDRAVAPTVSSGGGDRWAFPLRPSKAARSWSCGRRTRAVIDTRHRDPCAGPLDYVRRRGRNQVLPGNRPGQTLFATEPIPTSPSWIDAETTSPCSLSEGPRGARAKTVPSGTTPSGGTRGPLADRPLEDRFVRSSPTSCFTKSRHRNSDSRGSR